MLHFFTVYKWSVYHGTRQSCFECLTAYDMIAMEKNSSVAVRGESWIVMFIDQALNDNDLDRLKASDSIVSKCFSEAAT